VITTLSSLEMPWLAMGSASNARSSAMSSTSLVPADGIAVEPTSERGRGIAKQQRIHALPAEVARARPIVVEAVSPLTLLQLVGEHASDQQFL
jgi:hypothetical protein